MNDERHPTEAGTNVRGAGTEGENDSSEGRLVIFAVEAVTDGIVASTILPPTVSCARQNRTVFLLLPGCM